MEAVEVIHDLEALKADYMERNDGCYPVSLDYAIDAVKDGDKEYNRGWVDGNLAGYISAKKEATHGEWRKRSSKYTIWQCSNCNQMAENWTYFCPWCGADMRGDANEAY